MGIQGKHGNDMGKYAFCKGHGPSCRSKEQGVMIIGTNLNTRLYETRFLQRHASIHAGILRKTHHFSCIEAKNTIARHSKTRR